MRLVEIREYHVKAVGHDGTIWHFAIWGGDPDDVLFTLLDDSPKLFCTGHIFSRVISLKEVK